MRRGLASFVFLAALGLPAGAAAEIYRWVDAQGHEHFTTDLGQIPAAKRAAAQDAASSRPTVNRADAAPARTPRPATPRPRPYSQSAPADVGGERIAGWNEEKWRERAGALATEVEIIEKRLAQLEEMGADHKPLSASRRGTARRRYSEYRARYSEWEKTGRDLQRAEARLERFEERARRSGVPPGWLR